MKGSRQGVKRLEGILICILLVGLLVPPGIIADDTAKDVIFASDIVSQGGFARVSQITLEHNKIQTQSLLLGESDVSFNLNPAVAGTQITITIEAGSGGINEFIDIFDENDSLMNERIELTGCSGGTCIGTQIANFSIPVNWQGEYYLQIFDVGDQSFSQHNFTVLSQGTLLCELTSATWNETQSFEGAIVSLIVDGNNCDGETLSFEIYEDDLITDDLAFVQPSNVTFVGNQMVVFWVAERDELIGNSEYYYYANVSTGSLTSGILDVADNGTAQCNNGLDDDLDGASDFGSDFSCTSALDNDETNPLAQCQDGIDNDLDFETDWPDDPSCLSLQGNDENAPVCGDGNCDAGEDPGNCPADCAVSEPGFEHYIRVGATGANDGSSWDDAWNSFDDVVWERGRTYYVASGDYRGDGRVMMSAPESADEYIIVKKAIESDHGNNTGWQTSFGIGSATLYAITLNNSNWIIDGQTGGGPGNWETGHGFEVTSGGTYFDSGLVRINDDVENITFTHMDIHPYPVMSKDQLRLQTDSGAALKNVNEGNGVRNITISYSYLHHVAFAAVMTARNWDQFVIEYNKIGSFVSHQDPGLHAECFSTGVVNNGIIRHNIFEGIEGTGCLISLAGEAVNWDIYGNVFEGEGGGNGIVGLTDSGGGPMQNIRFFNNAVLNNNGASSSITVRTNSHPQSSGNIMANNIFYNISNLVSWVDERYYNYYSLVDFNSQVTVPTGPGEVPFYTGSYPHYSLINEDPFVDSQNGDYRLKEEIAGYPGLDLFAEFGGNDTDMFGVVRGADGVWDRGAIEFVGLGYDPGTTRYIRKDASAGGDGLGWATAWNSFDDVVWTRGNTYLVADGDYLSDGSFTVDAPENNEWITIKKAVDTQRCGDYGLTIPQCQGNTSGWQDSYGDEAAIMPQITIDSSHWTIDGQIGGGPGHWTEDHGFVFPMQGLGGSAIRTPNGPDEGPYIFKHIEAYSDPIENWDTPHADGNTVFVMSNDVVNDIYIGYMYVHNISGLLARMRQGNNATFEYNYVGPVCGASIGNNDNHCEHIVIWGYDNFTFRYNVFKNAYSSGMLISNNHQADNWSVYGNIFYNEPSWSTGSFAIKTSWGSDETRYANIINNAFINIRSLDLYGGTLGATNRAYNNIIYDGVARGGHVKWDYNFYSNVSTPLSFTAGDHEPQQENENYFPDEGDPFIDWVADNFNLSAAIAPVENVSNPGQYINMDGVDVCNNMPDDGLPPIDCSEHPFNVDMFGNVRGSDGVWDRGAIEYSENIACNGDPLANCPVIECRVASCDGNDFCQWNSVADGTGCSDDGNACTQNVCQSGTCSHPAGNEGGSCDDGDACTFTDICSAGVCGGTFNASCAPSGLLLHLPFNGDTTDASGNGFDATINGGVSLTDDRDSNSNSAYAFDGSNGFMQSSLDLSIYNDYSISLWVKADSTNYASHILYQGDGNPGSGDSNGWGNSGGEMHLSFGQYSGSSLDNRLSFFDGNDWNDANSISMGTSFADTSNWHHVAVTVSDVSGTTDAKLYLDGVEVASDTGNSLIRNWDTDLQIGKPADDVRYLDGSLDEVRVYDYVLNTSEIQTLAGISCTVTETPESTCDDGIDNDCDAQTDCSDNDCSGESACEAQSSGNFKIAAYNLLDFYGASAVNQTLYGSTSSIRQGRMRTILDHIDADIFFIQEISRNGTHSSFVDTLASSYYHDSTRLSYGCSGFCAGIFSKYPIVRTGSNRSKTFEADIDVNGTIITVLSYHGSPNDPSGRFNEGNDMRDAINALRQQYPERRFIVAGDYNSEDDIETGFDQPVKILREQASLNYVSVVEDASGDDRTYKNDGGALDGRIDWILASQEIIDAVTNATVIQDTDILGSGVFASDHRPVVYEFDASALGTPVDCDGQTRACSTGIPGACSQGIETCTGTVWGSCTQSVFPTAELCSDGLDTDCDGFTDCIDSDCSAQPECVVQLGDPLGWWTMDNYNATGVIDETGNGHFATYRGDLSSSSFVSGQDGEAIYFDGAGDYLDLGTPSTLNLTGALDTMTLHLNADDGTQGLTYDGTYFYWGHNNGVNQNSTIYKINAAGSTVDSFLGPVHGTAGDYKADTGTLLFSGTDSGVPYEIWELDTSGNILHTWNLDSIEVNNGGGMVAWVNDYTVYFRTGVPGGRINISLVDLHLNGSITVQDTWEFTESFGPGQGIDYLDGYLYMSGDWPASSDDEKWIVKMELEQGKPEPTIVDVWHFDHNREFEGLTFDPAGQKLYVGDYGNNIYETNWPIVQPKGLSVTAWMNRDAFTDNYAFFIAKGDDSGSINPFSLGMHSGNPDALTFRVRIPDGDQNFDVNNVIVDDTWIHVGVTYDGIFQRVYIDGTEADAQVAIGKLLETGGPYVMGCDINSGSAANCYQGALDDVRMYAEALGPNEIAEIFSPSTFDSNTFIEAERGVLSPNMVIGSDVLAFNSSYVSSTDGTGSATYLIDVNETGWYRMEARVLANSADPTSANSFYFSVDSESVQGVDYYAYDSEASQTWFWDEVNRRGNGDSLIAEFDPFVMNLTQGVHNFTFFGREADAQIDQLILIPTTEPPQPDCAIVNAAWNLSAASDGDDVLLTVNGTYCDGETASVAIWEDDGAFTPDFIENLNDITFSGDQASIVWSATFTLDNDGQTPDPEYVANVTLLSNTSQSVLTPILNVSSGSVCGNGQCEIDEDDQNCPADCLVCTDDDGDGYSIEGGACGAVDCNDASNSTYPGAPELCDTNDNNCASGTTDDGEGESWFNQATNCGVGECASTGIYICSAGSQIDTCTASAPEAELCDTLDNDCDGNILDDGVDEIWINQITNCGVGECASTGTLTCVSGSQSDSCSAGTPQTEVCDGLDNDCDGTIDNGVLNTYYLDNDGDGFGDALLSVQSCIPPAGYVSDNTDCNDGNDLVFPGQSETCNGVDDNCVGGIDEGACSSEDYFCDIDNDTFIASTPTNSCIGFDCIPAGCLATQGSDCNDGNDLVFPGQSETCNGIDDNCNSQIDEGVELDFYQDSDGDSFGDGAIMQSACTPPVGFVSDNTDCNDANGSINPGASEVCNTVDDNCNSQVDEGVQSLFYQDGDGDNFGNTTVTTLACSTPLGYSNLDGDCNDANDLVYPGQSETCNGIDDNCVGGIDEGACSSEDYFCDDDADGHVSSTPSGSCVGFNCIPGGCFDTLGADCNDANGSINPGASEVCNAVDDNCNSQVDEGVETTYYLDNDSDLYGDNSITTQACSAPLGYVADNTDCDDSSSGINPGASEICDSLDNNCDTQIDEGVLVTYYQDSDSDTFGDANVSTQGCSAPLGFVTNNTDCNDGNSNINPAQIEVCNAIDDNCVGGIDEGACSSEDYFCDTDGDGYLSSIPSGSCTGFECYPSGCSDIQGNDCNDANGSINPGQSETCNGVDDNCNTQIDEGVQTTYYADVDNDLFGDINSSQQACSAPLGFVADNTDCNDGDGAIYPGAPELCDGNDNNCDGSIADDGASETWINTPTNCGVGGCAQNGSLECIGGIQQDTCSATLPQIETCDGIDNDCDGSILDDGEDEIWFNQTSSCGVGGCADSGITTCQGGVQIDTCTPGTPDVEACDGIDNDCDGSLLDDGEDESWNGQSTSCGVGECQASGELTCMSGTQTDTCTPSAPGIEVCDLLDNNCDGFTDEGVQTTYYQDIDSDSFGNATVSQLGCSAPIGYVDLGTDCNDANPFINPNQSELCNGIDENCDTQIDEGACSLTYYYCDLDGDGAISSSPTGDCTGFDCIPNGCTSVQGDDCDDTLAGINPSATEVCDGLDNNCDSSIDEGVQTMYYQDDDGDSFGNASFTTLSCSLPVGFVLDSTDCDDDNSATYPGAPELCDGLDNNCDASTSDDGFGESWYGNSTSCGLGACSSTGVLSCSGGVQTNTCVAGDPDVELCDGIDNDCDGTILDDGDNEIWLNNPTSCGVGECVSTGIEICNAGVRLDTCLSGSPTTEVCDGLDNNCDGQIDEGLETTYYFDSDGDGYGNSTISTIGCNAPLGYVAQGGDCNDANSFVNPGATEVCNSIDDNCVSGVDEGVCSSEDYYCDLDNDGFISSSPTSSCTGFDCIPPGCIDTAGSDCDDTQNSIHINAVEVCDGVDNNCDASIDEGVLNSYYQDSDSDGFGNSGTLSLACSQPAGFVSDNTDCDDTRNVVYPGAPELCDAFDNDCDGSTNDDGSSEVWFNDPTSCGVGACGSTGAYICNGGVQEDTCNAGTPVAEVCDGIDNDCDGSIDNNPGEGDLTLTQNCGSGACGGVSTCLAGSNPGNPLWSNCSTSGNDCGTCCSCDNSGTESFDGSQDDGTSVGDCDSNDLGAIGQCDYDANSFTWDSAPAEYSTCQSLFTCSTPSYATIDHACADPDDTDGIGGGTCSAACDQDSDCDDGDALTVDSCDSQCGCQFVSTCGNNVLDPSEECDIVDTFAQYREANRCSGSVFENATSCNPSTCQATYTSSCVSSLCGAACSDGEFRDTGDNVCVGDDLHDQLESCNSECAFEIGGSTLTQNCTVICNSDGCNGVFFEDYDDSITGCVNNSCVSPPVSCTNPFTSTCSASCGAECETNADCDDTSCASSNGCYLNDTLVADPDDCLGTTDCTQRNYNDAPSLCDGSCGCTVGSCDDYGVVTVDADGDFYDAQCDQDCNDANPLIYPGNLNTFCDCNTDDGNSQGIVEICDGFDNDCDGLIDEDDVCNNVTLECNLTSAYWMPTLATDGAIVQLIVEGENCQNKFVDFDIFEDDGANVTDDDVLEDPGSAQFLGTTVTINWTALYDGYEVHLTSGNPEYYYIASLLENTSVFIVSSTLEVLENCSDLDLDGFLDSACGGTDCNDNNSEIYVGASDTCSDGIDSDCDGIDPQCAGTGSGGSSSRSSSENNINAPPVFDVTPVDPGCTPEYDCTSWDNCQNGIQRRDCSLTNGCDDGGRPLEYRSCEDADVEISSPTLSTQGYEQFEYILTIENPTDSLISNLFVDLDLPPGWSVQGDTTLGSLDVGESEQLSLLFNVPLVTGDEEIEITVYAGSQIISTETILVEADLDPYATIAQATVSQNQDLTVHFVIDNREQAARNDLSIEFNINQDQTTKLVDLITNIDLEADAVFELTKDYDIGDLNVGSYSLSTRVYDQGFIVAQYTSTLIVE